MNYQRYLLCIEAGTKVAAHVQALEARIAHTGARRRTTAPVHITLLLADLPRELAPLLTAAVNDAFAREKGFTVRLKGITYFRDRRTIYVAAEDDTAMLGLVAQLRAALSSHPELPAHDLRYADHPHLTIASGLKPDQFANAWAELAAEPFEAIMPVNELTLFTRSLASGASYERLQRFQLAPGATG